ncbi:hypothetical protein DF3PB_2220007 [uncultured Defluviicoccus sp.]|uniref:Uncharacterized protein n=1 Tax=metagenome TaxID=256318 RepID=A0A380TBU8_9ZZZZ|nr:hypothetical protein DF3PB_2220007 [uncultured Defluviicoccus sp.]
MARTRETAGRYGLTGLICPRSSVTIGDAGIAPAYFATVYADLITGDRGRIGAVRGYLSASAAFR